MERSDGSERREIKQGVWPKHAGAPVCLPDPHVFDSGPPAGEHRNKRSQMRYRPALVFIPAEKVYLPGPLRSDRSRNFRHIQHVLSTIEIETFP